MILREFCAENLTALPQLQAGNVARMELCDNLAVGGTTPSYGVIKEACRLLHEKGISVAVMIRPRGGNFVYNDTELRVMEEDILQAVTLEADALVFGILTIDNQIDREAIEQLLPATQGIPLVFHMAFDAIPAKEQFQALDQLVELGFTRILLHGSKAEQPIHDNIEHLKALNAYADQRIELMIGGGVTADNYQDLTAQTGITQAHGTRIC